MTTIVFLVSLSLIFEFRRRQLEKKNEPIRPEICSRLAVLLKSSQK